MTNYNERTLQMAAELRKQELDNLDRKSETIATGDAAERRGRRAGDRNR